MPSWDDLKPRKPAEVEPTEFEVLCMQTFMTPSGQRLLKLLQEKYIKRVLPGVPETRALDALNAKRQVVREVEDAIVRAQSAIKPVNK